MKALEAARRAYPWNTCYYYKDFIVSPIFIVRQQIEDAVLEMLLPRKPLGNMRQTIEAYFAPMKEATTPAEIGEKCGVGGCTARKVRVGNDEDSFEVLYALTRLGQAWNVVNWRMNVARRWLIYGFDVDDVFQVAIAAKWRCVGKGGV